MFAEFVNGYEITGLFVVPAADLGEDLAGGAFFPPCYIADVFGIDEDIRLMLFNNVHQQLNLEHESQNVSSF